MGTKEVDEDVFLVDRVVMMTSGPEAHVGEILEVPFERPRNRHALMDSSAFYELREQLVGFLEDQGHRPAPSAPAIPTRRQHGTSWSGGHLASEKGGNDRYTEASGNNRYMQSDDEG